MILACLMLVAVGLAVSFPLTLAMERWGLRAGALDGAGVPGQEKAPARRIPNIGGIAIFWGVVGPALLALGAVWIGGGRFLAGVLPAVEPHLEGIRAQTPLALLVLLAAGALHVVGLIDDRRPMGPWLKLAIMLGAGLAIAWPGQTRLLELLDGPAGGAWLSVLITMLWVGVVINAMNFMDNMDGLSGGVGAIAASAFLAGALLHGQWFVAALLALLLGALLGFLARNIAPARIFMGDGGSLVLGFLLAFLSVRLTYASIGGDGNGTGPGGGAWYAVLTPLVVLAVPLYDFASVVVLRLREGRSPFVGDLRHLSHRLVRRGMTRRSAVAVIWGLAAATAAGGVTLGTLDAWQAGMVGVQTLLVLGVIAILEFATAPYIADDPKALGPKGPGEGR